MSKVEVEFSAHSEPYGAKPGDRKKVPADEVPELERAGFARPVTVKGAKQAGLEPEAAVSKK